jgi:O-antigen/teichoic acid export membrane protein
MARDYSVTLYGPRVSFPPDAQPAPELLTDEEQHTLDSAQAGERFIRGSFGRLAAYVVSVLMSLISAPLVIRHLGSADYGTYAIVQAIVFIIGGFTEGGLNALGIREYSSGRPDRDVVLRNLVGLRVTATATAIVVVALVATLVGARAVVVDGVLLAGAGLTITVVGENYGIPLSAELRINTVSLLGLAQQAALTACYLALVITGGRILPLLASTVVSGSVLLLGTAAVVGRRVSIAPSFDPRIWRQLLRETLPYALASAVGIIYFREALVLMGLLSNDVQASYYGAAFKIVDVLMVIPYQLVSAAFPILTRAAHTSDDSRMAYALQRLVDVGLIAGLFISGSIWVGARFGIEVVAGHGFGPSVDVLKIQGISLIGSFMVAIYVSALLSMRMYRQLLATNLLAVIVATVLSVVLIPGMGARGAAIAAASAEIALGLGYMWGLTRARPELRISFGVAPKAALATAVALAAALVPPLPSVAALFVFGAVNILLLALLRAIPFEVINAILGRRPPLPDATDDIPRT